MTDPNKVKNLIGRFNFFHTTSPPSSSSSSHHNHSSISSNNSFIQRNDSRRTYLDKNTNLPTPSRYNNIKQKQPSTGHSAKPPPPPPWVTAVSYIFIIHHIYLSLHIIYNPQLFVSIQIQTESQSSSHNERRSTTTTNDTIT